MFQCALKGSAYRMKRHLFWIRQKPVEFLNEAVIGWEIIMCRAVQFSAGTWNLFYTMAI